MKILCVIVLYKCKLEDSKSYQSLLRDKDITIFAQNSGLGVAYNKAAQYAKCEHFEWLLLLDQDTIFSYKAMDIYMKSIMDYPYIKMFVPIHQIADGRYISPARYICKGSHPIHTMKSGLLKFKVAAPINSGVMVNVDAFYKAGGYDEKVILDFSKLMVRYKIFLQCALACKREYWGDYFSYFFVTAKRTLRLLWQTGQFSFVNVYITNYLFRK